LNGNNILKIIDCHVDQIYSLAINRDGSMIATTSKDKILRVIEPRSGIVRAQGICHNGTKVSKVVFLSDDKLLTTGFSKHSDRQYAIWDQNDLKKPLVAADIDSASGVLQPFFDIETKTLYLCGKGEGCIRYYEIVDNDPYIYYLNQFISGQPQKALGWMPKRGLNVSACEIFRFYKLHASGNVVEPISFIVPRKSSLFQADLYPDTLSTQPAMTVKEWFVLGSNIQPILMSMQKEISAIDIVASKKNLNGTIKTTTAITTATKIKDEENINRKQVEIIETKTTIKTVDHNLSKKFAFLSQETTVDYRSNERLQNKQDKTNTNQSTKIQQLQSIFGQQTKENGHTLKDVSAENINLIHAENEVKKNVEN
jgi:coronin-2